MPDVTRDALLRSIEEFADSLDGLQKHTAVLTTPVFSMRLDQLEASAKELGDPIVIAMIEKLRHQVLVGRGLDG